MDNKMEILLGSEKNINSVNANNYTVVELTNNVSEITEFNINDVVNSTDVFDAEREENQTYRIYGRIEYLSLLNGLKSDYTELEDFFTTYSGDSKNIFNSFDFYLVAPSSGRTYTNISNTNYYKRSFDVIATKTDIELFPAGFTNNVYGDQVYAFSFKSDFDVSEYFDYFGFPLTELFLYCQYKPSTSPQELMYYSYWDDNGILSTKRFVPKTLSLGGVIETNSDNEDIYDIVEYLPEEYYQEQVTGQTYYIRTPFDSIWLEWQYNPFIPLRLRYLDGEVSNTKLNEIVENGTTLKINNNGTNEETFSKSLKQSILSELDTITNWDENSSTYYNFNASAGTITMNHYGDYNIEFETEVYITNGSDKYIVQSVLCVDDVPITTTTKTYLKESNNTIKKTTATITITQNDVLSVKMKLIPNPDERKVETIPDYAKMIKSDGKYVWREILPQGYVEPLTGVGVDYPFFNKRRYLFSQIILDVIPNLDDIITNTVFNEISYTKNATSIDITPLTELDNIGKPCQ